MGEVILHSFWRSSCSWRVRIALEIKNIPYRCIPIDIVKERQQVTESYARVNPMLKVPSLYIDSHQMSESYSLVHYLDETRPLNPLLPREPINRAKVREVCEMIQSGIQPLQNIGVQHALPFTQEEKLEWAQSWIRLGFQAIEKKLSSSAGKYCFGDAVTMADIFLVPQVFNAQGYKVDLQPFPAVRRVFENSLTLEPFANSHPYRQLDAPPKVKSRPLHSSGF